MNASAHRSHAKNRSIDDLNARINNCTGCRLSATRKHPISGEGDPDTRLMLVALSPGALENAEGGMFLGPSGKILDNLFQSAGIEREQIYMTNLVKCMLPKNREPKWDEIEACSRFLEEEISILQPEFIVQLGYYATRKILTDCHADPPPERRGQYHPDNMLPDGSVDENLKSY
jgi:DNA polymerase